MEYGYVYACRSTTKWDPGIKLTAYTVTGNKAGDTISITADIECSDDTVYRQERRDSQDG